MGKLSEFLRRVTYLGRWSSFDRELSAEIRFHLESRTEELVRSGASRRAAEEQARREFGPSARSREDTRAAWQFQWIENFWADLRYAARSFRHKPGFAATAIACIALGIGVNTLIFTLVDSVLLRKLPYADPDRLVVLWFTPPDQSGQKANTNTGAYFTIRENSRSFEVLGAGRLSVGFNGGQAADDAERLWVRAQFFSPDLIRALGVEPILGHWPRRQSDGLAISHRLWQRFFGGSPDAIGKAIRFDSGFIKVAGVLPPEFELFDPEADAWLTQEDADLRRAFRSPNRIFSLVGRLKRGVTVEQAQAEMNGLALRVGEVLPETHKGWGIQVESLHDAYTSRVRTPLLILLGSVVVVLLIACANVAGLMLAQASVRQKELAMRAALGSSRGRIVRQLMTESVLLSLLGGALGAGLAWIGLRVFLDLAPEGFPRIGGVAMNVHALEFAAALSALTGLVFGAVPALQISRPDLMEVLRETVRSATAGRAPQRLRASFSAVQIALALVLLVGSGLLVRSLLRLNSMQAGFDANRLVTIQVPFARAFYRNSGNTPRGGLMVEFTPKLNVLSEQIRRRLETAPGVESATAGMTAPLGGVPRQMKFTRPGQPLSPEQEEAWTAEWYPVHSDYFQTLKIPMLRGRAISDEDSETGRPVAVINSAMARRFWPNDDPLGKQIQTDLLFDSPREVIGIVGDVRQNRFQLEPQPQMYIPRGQLPLKSDMTVALEVLVTNFVVRTSSDPERLIPSLRAAIAEVDRTQPVSRIRTVEEYSSGQLADLRQYVALLVLFGGISAMLAVVSLFGIMAHAVSQRRNEIGIRVALGASAGAVLGLVTRQGLVLLGIGLGAGLVASLLVARVIETLVWGVSVTDPATYAAAAAGLAVVALAACYLPARRALRIDPMIALREQ